MRTMKRIFGLLFGLVTINVGLILFSQRAHHKSEVVIEMSEETVDENAKLREKVAFLVRAIESYLDSPGCNIPARNTALAKLRWAAEEAKKP